MSVSGGEAGAVAAAPKGGSPPAGGSWWAGDLQNKLEGLGGGSPPGRQSHKQKKTYTCIYI